MDTKKYYWEDFKVGDTAPMGEKVMDKDEMIAFAKALRPAAVSHRRSRRPRQSMYRRADRERLAHGRHGHAHDGGFLSARFGQPGLAGRGQRALAQAGAARATRFAPRARWSRRARPRAGPIWAW